MAGPEEPLDEHTVDPDPLVQFGRWFDDAVEVSEQAMALATAGVDGRPSVRMVLLKGWGAEGFTFFTNYDSRKGHDLTANPVASLLFYWQPLGRQIRIDGSVATTSDDESDAYFATRPLGSRIGAIASHQGQTIDSRAQLHTRAADLRATLDGEAVPRPPWWGGFRLRPTAFEFWQHGADRLHDRVRYLADHQSWRIDRLQP